MRDFSEAQRSEIPRDGKHPQQKSSVADAVHDERFVGCGAGAGTMEIESNQQIRAQAHAFPAYEHQHVIVREDEREHGKHEEVEVSEETVIPALVRHVAGRINVDESANTSYEQEPNAGKRIEQKTCVGLERNWAAVTRQEDYLRVGFRARLDGRDSRLSIACAEPRVDDILVRLAGIGVSVIRVLPDRATCEEEREHDCANTNGIDGSLLQLTAEEKHGGRAERRQKRNEPDVG